MLTPIIDATMFQAFSGISNSVFKALFVASQAALHLKVGFALIRIVLSTRGWDRIKKNMKSKEALTRS